MRIFKKLLKLSIIMLILGVLVVAGTITYIKMSPKLEIKSANVFLMYDKDENLYFQGSGGAKEWISLNNISPKMILTTIETEDKKFYRHFGFDPLRIGKAIWVNITSKSKKEGASTISQQYARNLFLDFDKTWERKLNEMWLTMKLEVGYSKDEILEGYLNTINYGHAMYGVENAAQFYFDKSATNLTLAEAAMLTQIPNSPSFNSPLVNYDLAKKRQVDILFSLRKNNKITEREYLEAINQPLEITGKRADTNFASIMYYQDAVMRELRTLKEIPSSFLETGGLKIYTALDMQAQTGLVNAVTKNLDNEDLQVSGVMMDPNTGKIFALVGGKDYYKSQFNRAVQSNRQVGSTMKAFLYYTALENGFTSSTAFTSEETTFVFSNNKTYSPQNYGGQYGNRPISLATAMSYSDNIYAVKTHMFLGEEALVDISKRLGISSKLQKIPSLPLGTAEINIIEMAAAYGAFANEGHRISGYLIERVEDLKGNTIYERKEDKELVLNRSLTYILSDLLTTTYDSTMIDYNYPTAIGIAPKINHRVAFKSGTTNSDHWSIGYNKDAITAIWIGHDDNQPLKISDYKHSRNIWAESMAHFLKEREDIWYKKPNNVVGVLVNPITGLPATLEGKNKRILYYVRGTEPSNTQTVFDEKIDKE